MNSRSMLSMLCLLGGIFALTPLEARAHCDTMDGPVVTAAKRAVESGNIALVMIWVQKGEEAAIRESFKQTLAVRPLGP